MLYVYFSLSSVFHSLKPPKFGASGNEGYLIIVQTRLRVNRCKTILTLLTYIFSDTHWDRNFYDLTIYCNKKIMILLLIFFLLRFRLRYNFGIVQFSVLKRICKRIETCVRILWPNVHLVCRIERIDSLYEQWCLSLTNCLIWPCLATLSSGRQIQCRFYPWSQTNLSKQSSMVCWAVVTRCSLDAHFSHFRTKSLRFTCTTFTLFPDVKSECSSTYTVSVLVALLPCDFCTGYNHCTIFNLWKVEMSYFLWNFVFRHWPTRFYHRL